MNVETRPADTPTDEPERIRQWRAERALVADAEKQDRIRKQSEERSLQQAGEAAAKTAEAASLLPDDADLARAEDQLLHRSRANARRLIRQLAVFVMAPTLAVMLYLGLIAVPLYESRAVVVISKPGGSGDMPLGGILGSLAGQSNLNEAFMAQEYLHSQALMDALEAEMAWVTLLGGPAMDPVRRLRDLPALGLSKQDQFTRFVDSAINIQTGLITLYVRAPDPQMAIDVSQAVLSRTAAQITSLSEDLFRQRLDRARAAVTEAELTLSQAQSDLVQFQITHGEADPQARITGIFDTIRQLQAQAQDLNNQIEAARVAGQAGSFQTTRLTRLVTNLDARIAKQRQTLIDPAAKGPSLNALLLDFNMLTLQVHASEEAVSISRQALAKAADDAALGRSSFQIVVPPGTGTYPAGPNVLASGLVALLLLTGLFSIVKLLVPTRRA